VSNEEAPPEADPDEANARLLEGLKSCRAVVDRYRSMIANDNSESDRHARSDIPDPPLDTVP
jgi:hypothetical protein